MAFLLTPRKHLEPMIARTGKTVLIECGEIFYRKQWLGTGTYSFVEEVTHVSTSICLAKKTAKSNDPAVTAHLSYEARVLQQLRHYHIPRLFGAPNTTSQLSILLAPVADMTMSTYLQRGSPEDHTRQHSLKRMFHCLSSALLHVHQSGFSHGDIKPSNILVSGEDEENVLLSDFGSARPVGKSSWATSKGRAFTLRYSAPEVVLFRERGFAADIYSLGCVFLEMAISAFSKNQATLDSLKSCFQPETQVIYHRRQEEMEKCLEKLKTNVLKEEKQEAHVLHAISYMIKHKPSERITAVQLSSILHPLECCLSWPDPQMTKVSPFQSLYALCLIDQRRSDLYAPASMQSGSSGEIHRQKQRLLSDAFSSQCGLRFKNGGGSKGSVASGWLSRCLDSHQCGPSTTAQSFRPYQLLDIGKLDDSGGFARVVLSKNISTTTLHYAAISEFWGQPCEEYGQHCPYAGQHHSSEHSIVFKQLPTDAIHILQIARQVGIQYVWIAGLCSAAIRDNACTENEASLAKVYQYATITIVPEPNGCITSTKEQGFHDYSETNTDVLQVTKRDGGDNHQIDPREVDITSGIFCAQNSSGSGIPSMQSDESVWNKKDLWEKDREPQALGVESKCFSCYAMNNSFKLRMWSLLSPRVLWSCQGELRFACRTLNYSQTFPQGMQALLWTATHRASWKSERPNTSLQSSHEDHNFYEQHCDLWAAIVESHSRKELKDRYGSLNNLPMLADAMSKMTKDTYLAGLWRNSVSWALRWQPRGKRYSSSLDGRIVQTRFPSWSWFSCLAVGQEVQMQRCHEGETLIEVSNCNKSPFDADTKFFDVNSSTLSISARAMSPVTVKGPPGKDGSCDCTIPLWDGGCVAARFLPDVSGRLETFIPKFTSQLYFLWTLDKAFTGDQEPKLNCSLAGIAVVQDVDISGCFRRVGLCEAESEQDSNWILSDLQTENWNIRLI